MKEKINFDIFIYVDRSVNAQFPSWVKKIMYPELQNSGPENYFLSSLEQWFHEEQRLGVDGNVIFRFLKQNNLLEGCLSLQDGLAIQAEGIEVFKTVSKGKTCFLWKSICMDRYLDLAVPYLVERDNKVELDWGWLDSIWGLRAPAVRFKV